MRFRVVAAAVMLAAVVSAAPAQFKSQVRPGGVPDGPGGAEQSSLYLGFFDPARFTMRHSLEFSYQSFGGQGMSVGTYTNSMLYQVTDQLTARADVSLSYSPYSSMSTLGKNDFSSIYLRRAELNYRPSENFMVNVLYRAEPYGYYSPWGYGMWSDPWGR